ncbi:MAG TPA: class I SAM-dependent methyltransferase [Patescibacteria group bacterium]|nr:class I SAM-dependent methyltransferase [Patescibacteria group bacterium]
MNFGFIFINVFFSIVIIVGLIVIWWVWPPDSPWSLWWRTNGKKALAAIKLADIGSDDKVFELGSGDATFLVTCAKKVGAKCVGIEIDYIRHIIATFNAMLNGVSSKVELRHGNFFDYKLNSATVVFAYLVPSVLEKLKPKLFSELKKGTRIISYRYKFKIKKGDKMKYIGSDTRSQMHFYKIT